MFIKAGTLPLLSFCTLVFLACGNEKAADSRKSTQERSITNEKTGKTEVPPPTKVEDGPSIATITAPQYVAKVHKAIAFIPKDDGGGMMKAKEGHRFVVLDMSAKNTGKEPIEMGQILLSVDVKDAEGKRYPLNAMAIAAYTHNYPSPVHQTQYDALWGKMNPGDFFRTTVYGFEAPDGVNNFTISMKEDDDFSSVKKLTTRFTIQ